MPTITKLEVINNSGSTISKNKIVYIAGYNKNIELPKIQLADNRDENTMPAIGVAVENILDNTSSKIVTFGYIVGIDLRKQRSSGRVYVGRNGSFAYENPQDEDTSSLYQTIGIVIDTSRNGRILLHPFTEILPQPVVTNIFGI